MTKNTPRLAWHFVGETLRDGRPVPSDGEWLVHEGPVHICSSGLHASERLTDALEYAPGNTICRVMCEKIEDNHNDKFVCTRRKILWRINGEKPLRDFARFCAHDVLDLWTCAESVKRYLETGDSKDHEQAKVAVSCELTPPGNSPNVLAETAAWYAIKASPTKTAAHIACFFALEAKKQTLIGNRQQSALGLSRYGRPTLSDYLLPPAWATDEQVSSAAARYEKELARLVEEEHARLIQRNAQISAQVAALINTVQSEAQVPA